MSTATESPMDASTAIQTSSPAAQKRAVWTDIAGSPALWPGVALAFGFAAVYLPLLRSLWDLWTSGDGYYSHGLLVPPICGYIVYRNWPRIKDIPTKPAWLAAIPIALFTWVAYRVGVAGINLILAACHVGTIVFGTALIAGWRWMLALLPASLYSVFAMPFWNSAIDAYTNPLQQLSSKVAFQFLKLAGFTPYTDPGDPTSIYLNHFALNVAVPCSGLKLVLALAAFVTFFVLIAKLKTWANIVLVASVLPMALVFNGIRIALIGAVGDYYGRDTAMQFHDYSGFITLGVCFFVLFKFARALGWQD